MALSAKANEVISRIGTGNPKLGELRKIAKEIKKDHDLALELWSTEQYSARMLSILIMDKGQLTQDAIEELVEGLSANDYEEKNRLSDWLLANQLMKSKMTITLLESWEDHPAPIMRRLFWYHQARLRWTGQEPPENTDELLVSLKAKLENEEPEVQWAMNFLAGQIGIHQPEHRAFCTKLGEDTGLYKDEKVPPNCTPNYLPEFIRIEAEKFG